MLVASFRCTDLVTALPNYLVYCPCNPVNLDFNYPLIARDGKIHHSRKAKAAAPLTTPPLLLRSRLGGAEPLFFRQGLHAHATHDFVAIAPGIGFDGFFVQGQQAAIAHDDAAFDDDGADIVGFGGVNQI